MSRQHPKRFENKKKKKKRKWVNSNSRTLGDAREVGADVAAHLGFSDSGKLAFAAPDAAYVPYLRYASPNNSNNRSNPPMSIATFACSRTRGLAR